MSNKKLLTHKIEATPQGWQVTNCVDGLERSTRRTRTLWGARFYIWRYQNRIRRQFEIENAQQGRTEGDGSRN